MKKEKDAKKEETKLCFYCGAALLANDREDDHFPIPQSIGGKDVVPCCLSCHDMKDRINIGDWSNTWLAKVLEDFPKFNRETKLFLAKVIRLATTAEFNKESK